MAQTRIVVCLQSKLCVIWSDFHLSMSKDLDWSWNWCTSPGVDGSMCEWKAVGIIIAVVFTQLSPVLCHPLDCSPPVSFVHQILQAKNTGSSCHFLLQRIFRTQGSILCLLHPLHWQDDSSPLCHLGWYHSTLLNSLKYELLEPFQEINGEKMAFHYVISAFSNLQTGWNIKYVIMCFPHTNTFKNVAQQILNIHKLFLLFYRWIKLVMEVVLTKQRHRHAFWSYIKPWPDSWRRFLTSKVYG